MIMKESNFQKLIQRVRHIDRFGKKTQLRLLKKEDHKTNLGGFLTILLVALIVLSAFNFAAELYFRQDPITQQQTQIVTPSQHFNFSVFQNLTVAQQLQMIPNDDFQISFGIFSNDLNQFFIDSSIFTIEVHNNLVTQAMDSATGKLNKTSIKKSVQLVKCSELAASKVDLTYFELLPLEFLLCVDPRQTPSILIGGQYNDIQHQEQYEYLSIEIIKCRNGSNNSDDIANQNSTQIICKSAEQIQRSLLTADFNLFLLDIAINFKDHDHPTGRFLNRIMTKLVYFGEVQKGVDIKMQHQQLTTDNGYFTNDYASQDFLIISDTKEFINSVSIDEDSILKCNMYMDQLTVTYTRQYIKVQEVLAKVGGIIKSLFYILLFLSRPFRKMFYYETVLNALYDFAKPQEEVEKETQGKQQKILEIYNKQKEVEDAIIELKENKESKKADAQNTKNVNFARTTSIKLPQNTNLDQQNVQSIGIQNEQMTSLKILPSGNSELDVNKEYLGTPLGKSKNIIKMMLHKSFSSQASKMPSQLSIDDCASIQSNLYQHKISPQVSIQESNWSVSKKDLTAKDIQAMTLIVENLYTKSHPLKFKAKDYLEHICVSKNHMSQKLVREGLNMVDEKLDIVNIFHKLDEIDKLKMLLLDRQQLQLFEFLPKPMLSETQSVQNMDSENRQSLLLNSNISTSGIDKDIGTQRTGKNTNRTQSFSHFHKNWNYFYKKKTQAQRAALAFKAYQKTLNKTQLTSLDAKLLEMMDETAKNLFDTDDFKRLNALLDDYYNDKRTTTRLNSYVNYNYQTNSQLEQETNAEKKSLQSLQSINSFQSKREDTNEKDKMVLIKDVNTPILSVQQQKGHEQMPLGSLIQQQHPQSHDLLLRQTPQERKRMLSQIEEAEYDSDEPHGNEDLQSVVLSPKQKNASDLMLAHQKVCEQTMLRSMQNFEKVRKANEEEGFSIEKHIDANQEVQSKQKQPDIIVNMVNEDEPYEQESQKLTFSQAYQGLQNLELQQQNKKTFQRNKDSK